MSPLNTSPPLVDRMPEMRGYLSSTDHFFLPVSGSQASTAPCAWSPGGWTHSRSAPAYQAGIGFILGRSGRTLACSHISCRELNQTPVSGLYEPAFQLRPPPIDGQNTLSGRVMGDWRPISSPVLGSTVLTKLTCLLIVHTFSMLPLVRS